MKVKISKENFQQYSDFMSIPENAKALHEKMQEQFKGKWHTQDVVTIKEAYEGIIDMRFSSSKFKLNDWGDKNSLPSFKTIFEYCLVKDLEWKVSAHISPFMAISFSNTRFFFLEDYVSEWIEETDYKAVTVGELQSKLGDNQMFSSLPAELNQITVAKVEEKVSEVEDAVKKLQKEKEDLSWYKNDELAAMKKEIEALEQKMRKRKDELMEELSKKMADMEEKKQALENQIFMLESQIYTIRSYTGETLELSKVRDGKPAAIHVPIVLNQKILYLDEDLARIASIYQKEINKKYGLFEDVIRYREDIAYEFCPQERCVTFFRLARKAEERYWDRDNEMFVHEELIHGRKMGFLFRNGSQFFMGWLDDEWGTERYVTFQENLMYRPGERNDDIDDFGKTKSDSKNSMLSRMFAISVLQGIIDNGDIVKLPEKVNLLKPNPYVIYNFADGWLMDDKYGDFNRLVTYLNQFTREKDVILLFSKITYADKRSNGENNRTHDCQLQDGIHTLNLIKDGSVYVSAKKSWSNCGATSNVQIYHDEYINLSYMNSIWLKYYIQTKKLGNYCKDYAKMIPHFKKAVEIIENREREEMLLIKKHYEKADTVPEWQELLSHWKIKNQIRVINAFQAKRVATYLKSGNYFVMRNIFEPTVSYKESLENFTSLDIYPWTSSSFRTDGEGEFSYNSEYHKNRSTFYIHSQNDWQERKEELLSELPEREHLEERKINAIREEVISFARKYTLDVRKLHKLYKENTNLLYAIDFNSDELPFRTKDALSDNFIETEVKSGQWNRLHSGYTSRSSFRTEFWYLYYLHELHQQYSNILYDLKQLAKKNWLLEIK